MGLQNMHTGLALTLQALAAVCLIAFADAIKISIPTGKTECVSESVSDEHFTVRGHFVHAQTVHVCCAAPMPIYRCLLKQCHMYQIMRIYTVANQRVEVCVDSCVSSCHVRALTKDQPSADA